MKKSNEVSTGLKFTVDGKELESKFTFGTLLRAQKKLKASDSQEILERMAKIDAFAIVTLLIEGLSKDIRKGFEVEDIADELELSKLKEIVEAMNIAMGVEEDSGK